VSTLDAGADQRRFEPPGQARRIVDHGPPLAAADVADRVDRVQVAAGEALDVRNPRQAGAAHAPAITRRVIERYVELDGAAGRSCPTPMAEAVARAGLTDREREVLVALAAGWSNTELAAELHLSEATVKTHVSSVLAKLGLRSRVQAVIAAYESGLVQPGDGRFSPRRERRTVKVAPTPTVLSTVTEPPKTSTSW
jgi:DNA-binding CsgD family transcriptional regulator